MLKRVSDWTAAVIVVLIAVASFVALLLMLRAVSTALWTERAAGWAQAIGSVGAIAAAFFIANGQHHRDRAIETDRRHTNERKILRAVKAIFDRIGTLANQINDTRTRSTFNLTNTVQIEALRATLKLLDKMPPAELPHEDIIILNHNLEHLISKTCDAFDREYAALEQGAFDDVARAGKRANSLLRALRMMTSQGSNLCACQIRARETES